VPTSFELGDFSAEVMQLGATDPRWYYVLYPKDTNKLIAFNSCASYEEAAGAALQALEALHELSTGIALAA
jgi:hypothetical protein